MRPQVLKAADFSDLKQVSDGTVPDPKLTVPIVMRNHLGAIIGRVFLMQLVHLEGTWVREDSRGRFIGYRLIRAAERVAKAHGLKALWAYTMDEKVEDYMKRLGYVKKPITVWVKEL